MKKKIIIVLLFIIVAVFVFNLPNPRKDLFKAIKEKQVEKVKRLIEKHKINLDPPRKRNQVNKPLAYAAAYGNLEIVKIFLQKGADINGQVAYGDCPIIKAVEHGHMDIVKYLIVNGADVNLPNAFGVSPFIGFCGMGEEKLVQMALAHGAKVNEAYVQTIGKQKGKKNWTALQSSVINGQLEIVKLLMEHGGNPYLKDDSGKNCFELAKDKKQAKVFTYLISKYNL